jgi:hypothetical protein
VTRWTVRFLALVSVLLAAMCAVLALSWRAKSAEAACYRLALAEGATPAVADADCAADPRLSGR